MDIRFGCDSCDQHIVVDDTQRGVKLPCPHCGRQVVVPPTSTLRAPAPAVAAAPSPVPATASAADITFECSRCQQSVVIASQGAGLTVKCPRCGQDLVVPNPRAAPLTWTAAPLPEAGRECPYCAATVVREAKFCHACGRDLPRHATLAGLGAKPASPVSTAVPAGRKRRWPAASWLAVLLLVYYLASPYIAVQRLKTALDEGDASAMEAVIDFPAVRESLKEQLKAAMLERVARQSRPNQDAGEALGAVLAAAIGPAIVDKMVDAYLTPAGMATLIRNARLEAAHSASPAVSPDPQPGIRWRDLDYAFFTSPVDFLVENKGVSLWFKLQGIRWRLTRVELPPAQP